MIESILKQAHNLINLEANSILEMASRLDKNFADAIQMIMAMNGRVVVVGMGKSGIIGKKIAATMASTGTPAFSVHPGEAFHGDLGMIRPSDVALLISNSGETEELIRILPFLQYQGNKIIAMTGNVKSTLAKHAHAILDVGVEKEACNNNLAPSSSTTCTLVMGDALALVLSEEKNFQPEDFARFHPGGSLGRKLLTKVSDVMQKERLPICTPDSLFKDIVHSINRGYIGLTLIMENNELKGIITDGDVRRAFDGETDVKTLTAEQIMTKNPKSIVADVPFAEAEAFMYSEKISSLVVKDDDGTIVGVLRIYDMDTAQPQI